MITPKGHRGRTCFRREHSPGCNDETTRAHASLEFELIFAAVDQGFVPTSAVVVHPSP